MSTGLIYKAIPAIMGEVGAIEKNRKGDGVNYKFRGIDDFYKALQPLLSKHSVFVVPEVIARERTERVNQRGTTLTYTILRVEHRFYASDGTFVTATTEGEAMDTSDKSCNKAMSAAMKYALAEVFCVPTEEDKDTELEHHEIPKVVPKSAQNQPEQRVKPVSDTKPQAVEPEVLKPQIVAPLKKWEPSEKQLTRLYTIAKASGYSSEKASEILRSKYGVTTSKNLNRLQYEEFCLFMEQNPITKTELEDQKTIEMLD